MASVGQAAPVTVSRLRCISAEGFHFLSYRVFGDLQHAKHLVICVHGLTRNSRDFDFLASSLATKYPDTYAVATVDVVGRGQSDRLNNKALYGYAQYLSDMTTLIANLTAQRKNDDVTWIGTSMGGIIGMMLSSFPHTPIRRLVLNDIGCLLPKESLQRIASYVGKDQSFASVHDVEQYFRTLYQLYGPTMNDDLWQHMATHGSVLTEKDGKTSYSLAYDPGIAANFSLPGLLEKDFDLSSVWNRISEHTPILVLHGEVSDVLPTAVARKMAERKNTTVIDYPEVGHVVPIMTAGDIGDVTKWLQAHEY